ncbi:TetR/AcrR family transcriptional regulator [Methylovirgula ligni]|uniref:TetR/AcrR family transcriptional regulator n=1 Tax=Methylovirgula ligni TaxID=569860 RepID=UPI001FE2388B|nr:TetR/AcrR family transcriptional regulator [Methylovirgula ligni]
MTDRSVIVYGLFMVRPREFDRDAALEQAMRVFWARGFAATSTADLVEAMGIARQSLYNAFGDKRRLYLEALETYQRRTTAGHLKRLNDPASPTEGVRDLLSGLIVEDDGLRAMGCMGVGAIAEFSTSDPELTALRAKVAALLRKRLTDRIREGQAVGEFDQGTSPTEAAAFIQMTMSGIQLAARGGVAAKDLRTMARFAVDRLKAI